LPGETLLKNYDIKSAHRTNYQIEVAWAGKTF